MAARKSPKLTVDAAQAEDVARKIWLAGVGAYGRMFAEATDRVGKAAGSANELFDQLVARGEVLEDAVRERLEANDATKKVAGVIGKIQDFRTEQRAALKARVETIRKAVDNTVTPLNQLNPIALSKQVEELSARLAALEGKAAKAKRAPVKPVVVKTAAKRAAKRVTARKTKR